LIARPRTYASTCDVTNDRFLLEVVKQRSAAFIEILTDTELVGIGETYAGYFCPEAIPEIVNFFAPVLIGQSPDDIPMLWERMYHCGNFWCRVGLGVSVLNGIEAALWDLKGKMNGVPVYELLGGRKHEKLLCYATGGPSAYPKERLAEKVGYYLSLGFHGFKVGVGSYSDQGWYMPVEAAAAADFEAEKLAFIRSIAGAEIHVMLDAHMGNSPGKTWSLETALAVAKAMEAYNLLFLEEPLPYNDPWGYEELCRSTKVAIAGGECLTAAYEWRIFAERDCFDIGQPDASFTGGLGEFMKVANLFERRDRRIATHSWGAGGSLMQNVHCGFAAANTCILEVAPDYAGLHSEVMNGSFVMKDGYALPPEAPGLGIVLTEEIKNRYSSFRGSGEFNDVPGKRLAIAK